jgi:2-dehydro-3-deoxyglucarate aldolase/4-hydroxy-2-oxoheptanedioate aldolase
MTKNFRGRLTGGDPLIGTLLSLPVPALAEIAADAGFDWLFLDMEHGAIGPEDLPGFIRAAGGAAAAVVRVPENREIWIKKALDSGADGLIIPHVNTGEEAARAVGWAKFSPQGGRSVGFTRANRYGVKFQEDIDSANRTTAVIAQVEHIDGVGNIGDILGVSGIDAIFVGPYDLSASLGKPGDLAAPDVREAIGTVKQACFAAKKPLGIFARDVGRSAEALKEGYSFVCSGIDVDLFVSGTAAIVTALRRCPS